MPRYVRDEILLQGLDLASNPTLKQHDAPGDVIQPFAYSIKWLQNALDMFHRKYPFASDLSTVDMTLGINTEDLVLASNPALYLPTDFILDVRNGILVTFNNRQYRLIRKSFQYFLSYKLAIQQATVQQPFVYAVVNSRLKVAPISSNSFSVVLWYYRLAATLQADDFPQFPDEWTLIEFIRLKALEWTRSIEPGTAQLYMQKSLAGFRSSGLLNEPEYEDAVPLENNQVFPGGYGIQDRNAWLGDFPQT